MVSRAKDSHTTNRVVRVSDDDWTEFGEAVGVRNRAQVIRDLIAWYLRRPGAKLPARPEASGAAAMPAGPVANPGRTRAPKPDAEG